MAALHHAIDAVNCIAACDTDAVRAAASVRRLYLPTRLLPEHYDIPCRYEPLPPSMAVELLHGYDAAARASLRAAIALDDLAAAIDAPSSMLAVARTRARPAASRGDAADHDSVHQQAPPVPPPGVLRPQAGQIEVILRSLHITEPGMLLRAAAIDHAAHDVLAHATASSRERVSINQQPRQRKRTTPDLPPRTAAKDAINAGADADHVVPESPVTALPAGRHTRTSGKALTSANPLGKTNR